MSPAALGAMPRALTPAAKRSRVVGAAESATGFFASSRVTVIDARAPPASLIVKSKGAEPVFDSVSFLVRVWFAGTTS